MQVQNLQSDAYAESVRYKSLTTPLERLEILTKSICVDSLLLALLLQHLYAPISS